MIYQYQFINHDESAILIEDVDELTVLPSQICCKPKAAPNLKVYIFIKKKSIWEKLALLLWGEVPKLTIKC